MAVGVGGGGDGVGSGGSGQRPAAGDLERGNAGKARRVRRRRETRLELGLWDESRDLLVPAGHPAVAGVRSPNCAGPAAK